MDPSIELPPPLVGRFELRDLLGRGGCGEVVLAWDRELAREVAIKLFSPPRGAAPDLIRRFTQEAEVAAGLRHPHIVPVYDSGVEPGGRAWILYQYVDGEDLRERLERGPPPTPDEVVAWGIVLAEALEAMHEADLVHRDVKPANVIRREDGWIFLSDLGLVRLEGGSRMHTTTGVMMGTPAFLPPEAWRLEQRGPSGDQFALAATLYELLYGLGIHEGRSGGLEGVALWAQEGAPLRAPAEQRGRLPALAAVLERGLRSRPEERFPDMASFREALAAWQPPESPPTATRVAPRPAPRASPPRRRAPLGVLAGLLVASAGLAWWLTAPPRPAPVVSPPTPTTPTAPLAHEEARERLEKSWRPVREAFASIRSSSASPYREVRHHLEWYAAPMTRRRIATVLGHWAAWLEALRDRGQPPSPAERALLGELLRGRDSLVAMLEDFTLLWRHLSRLDSLILGDRLGLQQPEITTLVHQGQALRDVVWAALDRIRSTIPPQQPPRDAELATLSALAAVSEWDASPGLLPLLAERAATGYGELPELLPHAEWLLFLDRAHDSKIPCDTRAAALQTLLASAEAGPRKVAGWEPASLRGALFEAHSLSLARCVGGDVAGDPDRLRRWVELARERQAAGGPGSLLEEDCPRWRARSPGWRAALARAGGAGARALEELFSVLPAACRD